METVSKKPAENNTFSRLFLLLIVLILLFVLIGLIFVFAAPKEPEKIVKEIPPSKKDDYGFPPTAHPKILPKQFKNDNATVFRLPNLVSPIEYKLTIQAFIPGYGYKSEDSRNMTFDGEVVIKSEVLNNTDVIYLHAEKLKIHEINITVEEKAEEFEEVIIHQNYIEIKLIEKIAKSSKVMIFIKYSAKLRNDSKGFYDTTYFDESGNPKVAVVTQMGPFNARLVVPCFDEPAYKATWKMTIIHPIGTHALSNNDLIDMKEYGKEFLVSTFLETPKMSTYLLAFFISDFSFLEAYTKSGIRVRVWSRAEEVKNMALALEAAVMIIDKFEENFGVAYPMKKLDMVEVKVFFFGAMENWGLITYRDGALGYNEKLDNIPRKRFTRRIIAHELVHQWFGNLVTMEFWTRLWLKEGFAKLFEMYGADVVANKTYNAPNQFLIESQSFAFRYEYMSLVRPVPNHPMTFNLQNSDEMGRFFGGISYQKSASVLSMIREVIGKSVFDEGVRKYLKANLYKNVVDEELYKHLQESYDRQNNEASSLDIEKFAKSWTTKIMFPVVFVRKIGKDQVQLTQFVFAKQDNGINFVKVEEGAHWEIPIYYRRELGKTEFLWLKKDPVIISNAKFVVLNIDSNAYYRVSYGRNIWNYIARQLSKDDTVFSIRTKYRLVEDATMFHQQDTIIDYLYRETEKWPVLPYLDVIQSKGQFDAFYVDKNLDDRWRNVEENYANDEKVNEVELDYNTIKVQCKFHNCLPRVQKYIDQMKTCEPTQQISQCSTVPAQLRALVYCIGKAYDVEFGKLVEKWQLVERRASEIYYFDNGSDCKPEQYQRKSADRRNFEMEQYEEMMKELRYRGIY